MARCVEVEADEVVRTLSCPLVDRRVARIAAGVEASELNGAERRGRGASAPTTCGRARRAGSFQLSRTARFASRCLPRNSRLAPRGGAHSLFCRRLPGLLLR